MILFCKNKQISREDGRKNCFSRDNSMVIKVKLSFQLGLSNTYMLLGLIIYIKVLCLIKGCLTVLSFVEIWTI